MINTEIMKVLNFYERDVEKLIGDEAVAAGFGSDQHAIKDIDLHHRVLSYIKEAKNCLSENRKDRSLCLLGFIRGCLFTNGDYSLNELNNHISLIDCDYKFVIEELKKTGKKWEMHSIIDDKIYWRAYVILIGDAWPVHYDEGFVFETKEDAETYLDEIKNRVRSGEELYGNGFSCNTTQYIDETTNEIYWQVTFCSNHGFDSYSLPNKLKSISELNEFIKEMRKKYS